ncbi:hypothetical protein F4808DRAFT_472195 [Astrocystis sublimbata]|nr:hypothetical protein F4808DRAFT_472195 [Astrocystis sublimbata]
MSWKVPRSTVPPPPPPSTSVPLEGDDEKPASNGGHGTDDALRVTRILEDANIPCCLVGISALIFYGAARTRPDWEICVPTGLIDKATELVQSEPHSSEYCMVEPWSHPSSSLLHTYNRFKGRGTDFHFILVPANDVHIVCEPSNLTRSLRGLPYPRLDVYIQSCLDTGDRLQLCDVIDGTDLPEQWGEDNLDLEGFNDMEWSKGINKRGMEFANGKFAHWAPSTKKMKKRDMWQSLVRSKNDRLDWTKPSDIFITQYRIRGEPDSWTILSEMY